MVPFNSYRLASQFVQTLVSVRADLIGAGQMHATDRCFPDAFGLPEKEQNRCVPGKNWGYPKRNGKTHTTKMSIAVSVPNLRKTLLCFKLLDDP